MLLKKLILLAFLPILLFLSSCTGAGKIWDPAPVKEVPTDVDERVRKNIEEGRGIKIGGGFKKGGDFQFASSNPMWRASLETLNFLPLANADYSGGIIISDWYSPDENKNESIKITIRYKFFIISRYPLSN